MRIDVPRRRPSTIRLTPLIDVVFILLVFFMLASSFLDWRAFDLSLPPAGATADPTVDPIVISVAPAGSLQVDGDAVPRDALVTRVESLKRAAPERPVVVRPAADAPVRGTVEVLDRLRAGGIEAVSLSGEAGR